MGTVVMVDGNQDGGPRRNSKPVYKTGLLPPSCSTRDWKGTSFSFIIIFFSPLLSPFESISLVCSLLSYAEKRRSWRTRENFKVVAGCEDEKG